MWDERYGETGFAYGTEPNDFLRERAPGLEGPVLSLGEGEGRNAVFLAARGLEVVALDSSTVGLAKAERLAAERGLSIRTWNADLSAVHLEPESWGAIVSIWCALPPALRARIHREVVRALRPGGLFLLEAYTSAQLAHGTGGPRDPTLLVSLASLTQELEGLELVVGREIEREVHEGRFHNGPSAVVQVLARRPKGPERASSGT